MQTLSKRAFLVTCVLSAACPAINAAIGEIMKAPDIQERYAGMGIFTAHTTPERVTAIMKAGAKQMGAVVKAAGIQPE
jgi:tripartite-type tricarboxylate transporter receptor subunit TctC